MTLTPAILTYLDKHPEEWAKTYALEFLRASGRDAPAGVAHKHAFDCAESTYKGLSPPGEGEGRVSREEWIQRRILAVWEVYLGEWQAFHVTDQVGEPAPYNLYILGRERMIARLLAQWHKADVIRTGRDPLECAKDQIRGRFLVARENRELENEVGRLDPEWVIGRKFTKAKGWAVYWWTHKSFTEKEKQA